MADPTGTDESVRKGDRFWVDPDPVVLDDVGGVGVIARESHVETLRLWQMYNTAGTVGSNPVSTLTFLERRLFTTDPNELQQAAEAGEPVWGFAQAVGEAGMREAHISSVSSSPRPPDEVTVQPPEPTEPSSSGKAEETTKPVEPTTRDEFPTTPKPEEVAPASAASENASQPQEPPAATASGGAARSGGGSPNRYVAIYNLLTQLTQESADTVVSLLMKNDRAGLIQAGVSQKQADIILQGLPTWRRDIGKAIEQVAARKFSQDFTLSQLTRYVADRPGEVLGAVKNKPDFGFRWNPGDNELPMDITTQRQAARHRAREGWDKAIILTYEIRFPPTK
jgi:hypothetical protein